MNSTRDEGVIKFRLSLTNGPAPTDDQCWILEKWRSQFYKLGFIGEYPNENIGYGNLSSRMEEKSFIITGSQTGHLSHLETHHYTKVIDCDLKSGLVKAEGLISPSSESLTHYAIYEANSAIQFVFHIHHPKIWQQLHDPQYDSISENIPYGTQDMANAASMLLKNKTSGFFVMKGHEDGIISYGKTADEAGENLAALYRMFCKTK